MLVAAGSSQSVAPGSLSNEPPAVPTAGFASLSGVGTDKTLSSQGRVIGLCTMDGANMLIANSGSPLDSARILQMEWSSNMQRLPSLLIYGGVPATSPVAFGLAVAHETRRERKQTKWISG